jgi:hypothetical protein
MARISTTVLAWRSFTVTATTLSPEVVHRLRTSKSCPSAAGSLTNCLIVAVGTLAISRSAAAVSAADAVLYTATITSVIRGLPINANRCPNVGEGRKVQLRHGPHHMRRGGHASALQGAGPTSPRPQHDHCEHRRRADSGHRYQPIRLIVITQTGDCDHDAHLGREVPSSLPKGEPNGALFLCAANIWTKRSTVPPISNHSFANFSSPTGLLACSIKRDAIDRPPIVDDWRYRIRRHNSP